MSRLRGRFDREKTINALLVCAIIVSASIIVMPYLIPRPPPEVTLHILARHDVSILNEIEASFLASSYAEDNNVVDIEWATIDTSMWNILVRSGSIDLVMGPSRTVSSFGEHGQLEPMPFHITSGINETIAGVPMKAYEEHQPIWCSYAMFISAFDILVNETMLELHGLTVPESVEDLLSPSFCPNGANLSLIGLDFPDYGSDLHDFQFLLTKSLGWSDALQNLTVIYANSRFYKEEGDSIDAILNGEIAITLIATFGQAQYQPHPTISQRHLQDQFVVNLDSVGIVNETSHLTESGAFVEFLLSPTGQSIWLMEDSLSLPVRREAFDVIQDVVDSSVLEEFNWICRSNVLTWSDVGTGPDFALLFYMNATTISARLSLVNCWENIYNAFGNASILQEQFESFREMLGEPLTIEDPETHLNVTFTEEFAIERVSSMYSFAYRTEVSYLWMVAANQRYELILSSLSALM